MEEKKKNALEIMGELTVVGHATALAIKEDYIEAMAKLENVSKEDIEKRLAEKIKKNKLAVKERLV
ncbi:hypothetical protein [Tenacibaculum larymnensis]|uniref:Uncharacterized protein n=1 Tax=Tenacibaculum larymnensis TaxID=2878201 RepID=A0A9X4IRQ2_9FLAO|nr:hypothetical protein [Tenacibaculum larymnensis]MDE1208466.1 hypothetical protein [Tenacibaculum larymnensis]